MRKTLDLLYRTSGVLACLFLIAIALLTLMTIASRFFGLNVHSTDEFAGWCMAASMFLGLASTLRSNEHIRVSLLIERLAPATRHRMEVLCLLIAAAFMAVFAWYAIVGTLESSEFNEMSQGMVPVPLWIPQTGMAAGATVIFIALVDDLVRALRGKTPSYQKNKSVSLTESI